MDLHGVMVCLYEGMLVMLAGWQHGIMIACRQASQTTQHHTRHSLTCTSYQDYTNIP